MSSDFFTDGIINSAVVNGMIRVEFASISLTEKDKDGKPVAQVNQRMVMTPQGFLKSLSNMEALADKLLKAGLITSEKGEKRHGPARDTETIVSGKCRRKESLVVRG